MVSQVRHLGPVAAVPPPPVNVIRPHDRDLKEVARLLAADRTVADALVFAPSALDKGERWSEVLAAASHRDVAVILDTLGVELSSAGTRQLASSKAPWADGWINDRTDEAFELITEAAQDLDGVLAPAATVPSDVVAMAPVERRVGELRSRLDKGGLSSTKIHYPLVGRLPDLERALPTLIKVLPQLPIDSIWLRAHRIGAGASVRGIRQYVAITRQLHAAGLPLIGDRAGLLGVGFTAFGATAGLSSGITMGERTDVRAMQRPPRPSQSGGGFMPPPRVYVQQLGLFLKRQDAKTFFATRGHKSQYGCTDNCCSSPDDTLANARRHFLWQRQREVHALDAVPVHLRASQWLDRWLRPASDHTHRLARRTGNYQSHADHMSAWRDACAAQAEADAAAGVAFSRSREIDLVAKPPVRASS